MTLYDIEALLEEQGTRKAFEVPQHFLCASLEDMFHNMWSRHQASSCTSCIDHSATLQTGLATSTTRQESLTTSDPILSCRGFGTVRYKNREEAMQAAEMMNNAEIGGRVVSVRIDRFA